MNTETQQTWIDERIAEAQKLADSTAEYGEGTYRHAIDGLQRAMGRLDVLHDDFAPLDFKAYDLKIDDLLNTMQRKIREAKRYNGWINYETWCAALWIDNEYNDYKHAVYTAEHVQNAGELAEILKDTYTENDNPPVKGMCLDLLNSALGSIDWYEVAEHYRPDEGWQEDRKEEETEE